MLGEGMLPPQTNWHCTPLPRWTALTQPRDTAAWAVSAATPATCCAMSPASGPPLKRTMGALQFSKGAHEPTSPPPHLLHVMWSWCMARLHSLCCAPGMPAGSDLCIPALLFVSQVCAVRWQLQGAKRHHAPRHSRLSDGRWLCHDSPEQGSHCSSHLVSGGRGAGLAVRVALRVWAPRQVGEDGCTWDPAGDCSSTSL